LRGIALRYVFLTSRLDAEHGGLTASLLRKAGVLARLRGIYPVIATFHDAAGFGEVAAAVRERYDLPCGVGLVNINHYYRGAAAAPGAPKVAEAITELCRDLPTYEVREVHDPSGAPYAATITVAGRAVGRLWCRPDGSVFQYRPVGAAPPGGPYPKAEVVLAPLTGAARAFRTLDGFRRHFMAELSAGELTYLVCEARALDGVLLSLENRLARKIFVFHSIHERPGSSVIRTGNRAVLNNLPGVDALVVLTPQQKADVVDRFGFEDRLHVIPHAITPAPPAPDTVPGKLVMVARLSEEKNVASAIAALGAVRQARPDAQLEVWGHGPLESDLKAFAGSLNLAEAVNFAGYTNSARAVFGTAECSLLTSRWEGFSLTIMESMAAGTPCIAYDTKYGPAAMILDGVNGHLVEPGNQAELARRIIEYLDSPASAKRAMSANAAARMTEFSEERLAERWSALFLSLAKPVRSRPPLAKRAWRRIPDGVRNRIARVLLPGSVPAGGS
jgi:poly(glycerol-phosphate) alpha-glucosyltransferase